MPPTTFAALATALLFVTPALVAQCTTPPAWAPLVTSSEAVTVAIPDGAAGLFAGGSFTSIGGTTAAHVAQWNGSVWQALASGVAGGVANVSTLLRTSSGLLVAAGTFTTAGGVAAANIAQWNGTAWSPLGAGIGGFSVQRVVELPNGDLVAIGNFTSAGGVAANNIARWNGTAWSPLGSGVTSPGGVLVRANGDLVAGGSFAGVTGFVARWNGTSWTAVGNLASMVPNAFGELANGNLIAAGYQTVQRWNGAAWSVAGTLGGGNLTTAYDIGSHPDGSVVVVGAFSTVTAGTATNVRGVARLDPATLAWSDLGSSVALAPLGLGGLVGRVLVRDDGLVQLCQVPALAGSSPVSVLAIAPGCQPAAVAYGTGCAGAGGLDVLSATSWPWLGTACASTCSGLPANALLIGAYGLAAASIPLATVLAAALPGCELLVAPDFLTTHVPSGGLATLSLPLPDTASFAGLSIRAQAVTLDVTTNAATASNGLEFVLGRL